VIRTAFIYISLIFSLLPFSLWSQEKPVISYTEDDGLANNNVRDVNKDEQGYLWIATDNGLSKFDGDKFVNFHTSDGLPGNMVWAVAHDEKNRIYVGCYRSGLAIMEDNKIVKVLHIKAPSDDCIRKLYYSIKHHLLLVGTDYGIYALKDSTLQLICHPSAPKAKSSILSIKECNDIIYFTVHTDLGSIAGCGFYKIAVNDKDISKSIITNIFSNEAGFAIEPFDKGILVSLRFQICNYLPETGRLEKFAQADSLFLTWAMASAGNNKIVLGGSSEAQFSTGIKVLNTQNHKITNSPFPIKSPNVCNIVNEPTEKETWFCTDNGLYCFKESLIEVYNSIDKTRILDITVIEDKLIVLTENNIWQIRDGQWKLLYDKKHLERMILDKSSEYDRKIVSSIPRDFIYQKTLKSLNFCTDNNQTYLMTYLGSISFPDFKTFLPINNGNFISKVDGTTLWIPSYHELQYFPSIKSSAQYNPYETFVGKPIKDILKISNIGDTIYFPSYYNGIYSMVGSKVSYLNSSNSKLDDMLTDMGIDTFNKVWCISKAGNLFKIGFKDTLKIEMTFNKSNSAIVGENFKWLKFTKHYLYLGTNKGLNKIPVNQLQNSSIDSISFFNKNNGYEYISADSPQSDSHGNIYVFNQDKVIKIADQDVQTTQKNIVFTDISIDKTAVQVNSLNNKHFKSDTKDIRIGFLIIKLPNGKNIKYRYRINESEWNDGNTISLQSLKSGSYKISCEAKDLETSKVYTDSLAFMIDKPFWLSWWFLVLFLLVLITIIYFIVQIRFVRMTQSNKEKGRLTREITELHIQSLQSQMNPHFVFNSLNSIQNFILSNKIKDAVNYLATLGSLIRINLEHVSEEYISLTDEITFLEQFIKIEKLRFKEVLNVTFICSIDDTDNIFIPPMLIQPLIENSIKYGSSTGKQIRSIQIEFSLDNDLLVASVTDNGIGRDRSMVELSHDHKSLGLKLIKERLELLNKKNNTAKFQMIITDLYDKDEPTGTEVQIKAPQFNRNKPELNLTHN